MHDVTYNQLKEKAQALQKRCQSLLEQGLFNANGIDAECELPPLKIAFVGQYSAGKSSLIKMLTGIEDIRIGAGVTTNDVTQYVYKGLHIVDTPGIRAGHCETHDDKAMQAIAEADLLIFVITNELFDDVLGADFRNLCFKQKREKELLIVINKSQNDSADPQTKLSAICAVLDPLIPENFLIVFTDAESYFAALDEDDEQECKELLDHSKRDDLVNAIDKFVAARGIYARLTTPLQVLQNALQKKLDDLSPGTPLEKSVMALLGQNKRQFLTSKRDLQKTVRALLDDLHSKIIQQGNLLADVIGKDEDDFKRTQTKINDDCKRLTDATENALQAAFDQSSEDLNGQLQELAKTPLGEKVQKTLNDAQASYSDHGAPQGLQNFERDEESSFNNKTGQRIAEIAGKSFSSLAKRAIGDASKVGLKAAKDSSVHKAIKQVGGFLNLKFKPWETLKLAENTGKAAKFLGPAMAAVGVVFQLREDHEQKKIGDKNLADKRKIRKGYGESADNTRAYFKVLLAEKLKATHDAPIAIIEEGEADIRRKNQDKSTHAQTLLAHINEIAQLRDEIGQKIPV